jgi:hypothetical protein
MAKPLNFRFLYRLRKHVMLIDLLDHVTPRQANAKQLFEQRLVKTKFRKNPYKSSYGINANKFYRYHF